MERQNRVLVVDDDPFALRSIAKMLQGERYQVVTAASGSEALELLKQGPIDLVLTDLKMPGVDGLEVLRLAREVAPQAGVLMLTGYAALESAIEALREGAYDYLVKPCSSDELKLKIERGLERVRLAEERQRAEGEIRQRTAQLESLRQVGLEITSELDLDVLLRSIVSRAIELLEGTAGGFDLYQPDRDVMEWTASMGIDPVPGKAVTRRGEGLSGKVLETGEPLIVDDYQHWKGQAAAWKSYPLAAVVGVPVRWGGEFLGVLEVLADSPRTFSPADAELLSLFATQAAIAIRNARLYEEARRRGLEQETVSRIAYALNTPDVRDAFPVLVEGLQDLTGCDVVSLIALDEAGEQFITTVLESPFPIPGEEEVTSFSATAAAEDLEAGHPHLTADLSTETHFPLEQALYQAGLRSWVTLPLLVGGEVFGALNLGGSRTSLFRENQLPVLRQIADAVALTLENSFFFQVEREQRELAEALEEAAATISSTLDPDQVLDLILEQVSRVVPNDAANIMLIEGDQAHVVRWRGYERFGAEEFVSTVVFRVPEVLNLQQMMARREPMVIPDTATYPDWVRVPVQEWLRSYAAAPIVVRGEVIGFLNVDSATPGFFTQAHAEALRAFADHAAAAIENARLYEAEQERCHVAEILRQTSTVLSSTLELDEVLELILGQLRQVIPYDSASIQRLQDGHLKIVACQGFEEPDKVVGLVFPLDPKFPNHRVVMTKAPLAIEDATQDCPHFKNEADSYESGLIRSWLGLPLIAKDRVIGMITVDRVEVRPYTAEEVQLAMTFANQAAIAIENARLFDETMERAESLSALYEIGKEINASLELDRVLEVICDEAMRATGAAIAEVSLVDLEQGIWEMKAIRGYSENWKGRTFSLDVGITGRVARTGELAIIPDARQAEDYLGDARIRSELTVPILSEGKVVGVVNLESAELSAFDEDDLRFVQALADQAAIAIKNARLFEETERLEAFNESVVQGMTEGIVVEGVEGYLTYVNPAMTAMLGYSPLELLGQHWTILVPPDQQAIVQKADERHERSESGRYELQLIHKDGTQVPVQVSSSPWFEEGRFAGTLAVITDITMRKQMEETLRSLALVDDLTELYNRRGFFTLSQQQLKTADRAKTRMVLLFADFDSLKQINDALGHSEGDRALSETADVLRETFRKSDIIARIGGDEFVVLAIETNGTPAEIIATRLQENLEAHNAREGRRYKLSLSVGLARYDPARPCSIDELLAQADRAMYEQKRSNGVIASAAKQ